MLTLPCNVQHGRSTWSTITLIVREMQTNDLQSMSSPITAIVLLALDSFRSSNFTGYCLWITVSKKKQTSSIVFHWMSWITSNKPKPGLISFQKHDDKTRGFYCAIFWKKKNSNRLLIVSIYKSGQLPILTHSILLPLQKIQFIFYLIAS